MPFIEDIGHPKFTDINVPFSQAHFDFKYIPEVVEPVHAFLEDAISVSSFSESTISASDMSKDSIPESDWSEE